MIIAEIKTTKEARTAPSLFGNRKPPAENDEKNKIKIKTIAFPSLLDAFDFSKVITCNKLKNVVKIKRKIVLDFFGIKICKTDN